MNKIEVLKLTDPELDSKVKIKGTEFDRRRTISESEIRKMRKLHRKGKSYGEIAKTFNVSYGAVRYNVDDEWKKQFNSKRDGKHTGKDNVTFQDRVAYKRELVASGKLSV